MGENDVKIKKIQKSSKAALTITGFAKIFAIVMAVILMLTGFLLIGIKEFINEEFAKDIESGEILSEEFFKGIESVNARESMLNGHMAETSAGYAFAGSGIMIYLAVIMYFMGKVFKEIRESYSPFRPKIVKNLKVIFVLITLISLRSSLLIGAVIGFSLWCVLNIFEYGCELQKQSDETL